VRQQLQKNADFVSRKYQNAEISNLIEQIKKYPKDIKLLLLIYLYSKNNESDKVLETHKLKTEIPTSAGKFI
jgi:hypothetical protein